MKKSKFQIALLFLGLWSLTFSPALANWTPPPVAAPGCPSTTDGCNTPLNSGSADQTKSGGLLSLAALRATVGATIDGFFRINLTSNGLGKILTSDATGVATWQNPTWVANGASGIIPSATSGGHVGIGPVPPGGGAFPSLSAMLDVNGPVRIKDGTQGDGKVLTSDASGFASWKTPAAGGGISLWNGSLSGDVYNANSGNVAIGATSASSKLLVLGPATTNPTLSLSNGFNGLDFSHETAANGGSTIRTSSGPLKLNPTRAVSIENLTIPTSAGLGKVLTSDASGNATWQAAGGGSGGVSKIIAGTNVTISPTTGLGDVTINAAGGITPAGGSGQVNYLPKWGTAGTSLADSMIAENTAGNKIGIGWPNPAYTLDVNGSGAFNGNVGAAGSFIATGNGEGAYYGFDANHYLKLRDGGGTSPNWTTLGEYGGIRFKTGNNSPTLTEKMQIAPNGNVGIGTTNPTANLHVAGDALVTGNTNVGGSLVVDANALNGGTPASSLRFGASTSGEAIASRRTAGANQNGIDFYTNSANRMTIANNGDVGIGTTAPGTKLDVSGIIRSNSQVQADKFSDFSNGAYYLDPADPTTAANLNGKVAVNADVQAKRLVDIDDGSYYVDPSNPGASALVQGDYKVNTAGKGLAFHGSGEKIVDNAAYDINIVTNSANRMTIMNGGNVGIGTTAPSQKLDVNGSANVNGNLTLSANGASLVVNGTNNDSKNLKVYGSAGVDDTLCVGSASSNGVGADCSTDLLPIGGWCGVAGAVQGIALVQCKGFTPPNCPPHYTGASTGLGVFSCLKIN